MACVASSKISAAVLPVSRLICLSNSITSGVQRMYRLWVLPPPCGGVILRFIVLSFLPFLDVSIANVSMNRQLVLFGINSVSGRSINIMKSFANIASVVIVAIGDLDISVHHLSILSNFSLMASMMNWLRLSALWLSCSSRSGGSLSRIALYFFSGFGGRPPGGFLRPPRLGCLVILDLTTDEKIG